jgi:hypothetical protein
MPIENRPYTEIGTLTPKPGSRRFCAKSSRVSDLPLPSVGARLRIYYPLRLIVPIPQWTKP